MIGGWLYSDYPCHKERAFGCPHSTLMVSATSIRVLYHDFFSGMGAALCNSWTILTNLILDAASRRARSLVGFSALHHHKYPPDR